MVIQTLILNKDKHRGMLSASARCSEPKKGFLNPQIGNLGGAKRTLKYGIPLLRWGAGQWRCKWYIISNYRYCL